MYEGVIMHIPQIRTIITFGSWIPIAWAVWTATRWLSPVMILRFTPNSVNVISFHYSGLGGSKNSRNPKKIICFSLYGRSNLFHPQDEWQPQEHGNFLTPFFIPLLQFI
jgi:hypothetical protein